MGRVEEVGSGAVPKSMLGGSGRGFWKEKGEKRGKGGRGRGEGG